MKKLTMIFYMLITVSSFGQSISVSKDSVSFFDFWVNQEASDSIFIYNNDGNDLSLDSIYSNYYLFYVKIYNNDSLLTESFVSSHDMIPISLQIPPHDSIKIVFNLFVPVIKSFNSAEIYTDTISMFNNSINDPIKKIIVLSDITLGNDAKDEILSNFELFQNYPNPFNPTTKIKFVTPPQPSPYQGEGVRERLVTLKVYDLLGREITTLVNEEKPPGVYEVEFDASSVSRRIASGIYIYQIKSGDFTASKKFVLMK